MKSEIVGQASFGGKNSSDDATETVVVNSKLIDAHRGFFELIYSRENHEEITLQELIKRVKTGAKYELLRDDDMRYKLYNLADLNNEWGYLSSIKKGILSSRFKRYIPWHKRKLKKINKRLNEITIQILAMQKNDTQRI